MPEVPPEAPKAITETERPKISLKKEYLVADPDREHAKIIAMQNADEEMKKNSLAALREQILKSEPEDTNKETTSPAENPFQEHEPLASMEDIRRHAEESGDLVLYHGGLEGPQTMAGVYDKIDLERLGTKQGKKQRTYGGFYLSAADPRSIATALDYARASNGNLHGFRIDGASRILDSNGKDVTRLPADMRADFAKRYDIVKGFDPRGRVEYVLLNKGVIKEIGSASIQNEADEQKLFPANTAT